MDGFHILLLIVCCGCTGCAWESAGPEKSLHKPEPAPSSKATYSFDKPGVRNDRFQFDFADNEKAWSLTISTPDFSMDSLNGRTRSEVLAFAFKPNAFHPPPQSGPNAATNLLRQVDALIPTYEASSIVQAMEIHTHKRVFEKYRLNTRVQKTEIEDSRDYMWVRTEFTGRRASFLGLDAKERVHWVLYATDYNPDRLGEIDCPLVVIALEMPFDIPPEDGEHLTEVLEKSVRGVTFYR